MVVTPMWKLHLLRFLGDAEVWLRNIFSTPAARRARYRQMVAEEAFETWMNFGVRFQSHIRGHIAAAERSGNAGNTRFWRDVLESAKVFDADPENRRKRDTMIRYDTDAPGAA